MGKIKIYDLEQFGNYHSAVFYDVDEQNYVDFVIHADRNDFTEYVLYLEKLKENKIGLIGYNNINYDYPLIHYILINKNILKYKMPFEITDILYKESQCIINEQYSSIAKWDTLIPQLDLYRIHHFNNKARATSLKHLEVVMRLDNVQDLPFPFDYLVQKQDIDTIQKYCKNDVYATYKFYLLSKDKIDFRKRIKKEYKIDCMNFSDVKIGEEILIDKNAKVLHMDKKIFRKLRTFRKKVIVNDIILPYISFDTIKFSHLLDYFKKQEITNDSKIKYTIVHNNVKLDYGQGGIHGIAKKGIFITDNEGELINVDVSSFYPNIAIRNKFHPAHISSTFCEVGKKLFEQRMEAKQRNDTEIVSAIKLALNGALFGKSNDMYSPMFDRQFFFSITINGQLLLSMLVEQFMLKNIPIVQVNTDGILVKCPKPKKNVLIELCNKWMKLTNLQLDYDYFNLIAQRDVNNYLAQYTNGKIKYKGAFEINKDYHKDHSMLIVPIALEQYIVNSIPIEETIRNHKNIFDFMKSQKVGKQYTVESHELLNNKLKIKKLQRINRYYISNKGVKIFKRKTETDRLAELEVNYNVTIMNKMKKLNNYDINYDYYISECRKIINILEPKQLQLWD